MWDLHLMLAETREQDVRRRVRERYLAEQVLGERRRSSRNARDHRTVSRAQERPRS